jgi:hypothetical protein
MVCRPSAAAPPRGGVSLASVKRFTSLVPRARLAPDGRQSAGSHPTESHRLNRRLCLAAPRPRDGLKTWAPVRQTSTVANTPGHRLSYQALQLRQHPAPDLASSGSCRSDSPRARRIK